MTLFVVPECGHNHNVAPTRERLWERLAAWARTVASAPGARSSGETPYPHAP